MERYVSESVVGQEEEKPTRQQRDAAYCADAGRKAVEVPLSVQEDVNRADAARGCLSEEGTDVVELPDELAEKLTGGESMSGSQAPVGTDLETRSGHHCM